MATNDVLDRLEALLAAATQGPWFRGSRWKSAWTHPPMAPTRPTCAYCDESEPSEVIPHENGKQARHRHVCLDAGLSPTLDDDGTVLCEAVHAHRVESQSGETVCGNYDFESGGVVNIPDAELIVAIRNAAPALIRLARAAIAMCEPHTSIYALGTTETATRAAIKALGEVRL